MKKGSQHRKLVDGVLEAPAEIKLDHNRLMQHLRDIAPEATPLDIDRALADAIGIMEEKADVYAAHAKVFAQGSSVVLDIAVLRLAFTALVAHIANPRKSTTPQEATATVARIAGIAQAGADNMQVLECDEVDHFRSDVKAHLSVLFGSIRFS